MCDEADSANVRFPPPFIYLIGLAAGILAGRALDMPRFSLEPDMQKTIAAVVALAGAFLTLSGAQLFARHGTAIIPHKPAAHLVTTGVYRWTRNPMYLGMAVLYCGLTLVFDSILALCFLPIILLIIQVQVIAREEAYLDRRFGPEYRSYKARVRRWI